MPVADDIERLHALHARGALNDAEFAQAKAQVLGAATAGASGTPGAAARPTFLQRLTRSATDRVLGGVCGGLGAHTDLPAWGWRVIFCLAVLYFGIGVFAYLLLWIFVPPAPPGS